jgi:hypothetical protein
MRALLAIPAAAAAAVSVVGLTHAPGTGALRDEGRWFTVALPAGWVRTAGFSCRAAAPPPDDCYEVAHYRGPDGAWLRIVVDPPAEPAGFDAVLPAAVEADGRIDPLKTIPESAVTARAVAVSAHAADREYLFLYGVGAGGDLTALRSTLAGFSPR